MMRPNTTKRFNVGDPVAWNSEAGHVSGTVIATHTVDCNYKSYVHHASQEGRLEPALLSSGAQQQADRTIFYPALRVEGQS